MSDHMPTAPRPYRIGLIADTHGLMRPQALEALDQLGPPTNLSCPTHHGKL